MPFKDIKLHDFNSTWNEAAGVYGMVNAQKQVIYIGQTDNLKRRHNEHCCDTNHLMHRYQPRFLVWESVTDPALRAIREKQLIAEYNPVCNRRL